MMQYEHDINPRNFSSVLSDLMERINRIKIMLWAGDATAARSEMQEIRNLYRTLIIRALLIKTEMLSRNRARKIKAEVDSQLDGRLKGWAHDYLVNARVARQMSARDELEALLFAIAPVASLVNKLDNRISRETNQRQIFAEFDDEPMNPSSDTSVVDVSRSAAGPPLTSEFDTTTGFRLLVFPRGDQTWEMRGYRLNPPALYPEQLSRQVNSELNLVAEELEEDVNDRSWPVRINAFSESGHFKLTVFDSGRFSVVVVLRRREEPHDWFEKILLAISKSQQPILSDQNSDVG